MANRLEKETILRERQQLQAKLDQLFAMQEQQTAGKPGKGGNKKALGDVIGNPKYWNIDTSKRNSSFPWSKKYTPNYYSGQEIPNSFFPPYDFGQNVSSGGGGNSYNPSFQYGQNSFMPNYLQQSSGGQPGRSSFGLGAGSTTGIPGVPSAGGGLKSSPAVSLYGDNGQLDPGLYMRPVQGKSFSGFSSPNQSGVLQQSPIAGQVAANNAGGGFFQGIGNRFQQGGGRGLMQGLGTAASFLGSAYDIYRGSQPADTLNASDYYNPQYSAALGGYNKGLSLLANRRYDPTAELQDVERQGAIFNQGLRNSGNIGAGALRNQLAGSQVRQQRGRSQIFNKKQNIDLGMMGEEARGQFQAAQGRAGLGAQRAATDFTVAQYNAQARAGQRNLLGAGLASLGIGAQTQQLMANQRMRDAQLGPYIDSFGGGLYYAGPQGVRFGGQPMTEEQWRQYGKGYGYA